MTSVRLTAVHKLSLLVHMGFIFLLAGLSQTVYSQEVSDDAGVTFTNAENIKKVMPTIIAYLLEPINSAPIIDSLPNLEAQVNVLYEYQVTGNDPDQTSLMYRLGTAPTAMSIDVDTGLITWTPVSDGVQSVVVIVEDEGGAEASQRFEITVAPVPNNAPTIDSLPNLEAQVNVLYEYQVTGNDPDETSLMYRLDTAPTTMSIDVATGLITWTPASDGVQSVVVIVEDAGGAQASQRFEITVAPVPNNAPIIDSLPNLEAQVSVLYEYQVTGYDPDETSLMYRLGTAPTSMSIDVDTGLITWTPVSDGVQSVRVILEDAGGAEASQNFEITVAPVIEELSVSIIANPVSGTSPLTVSFSADVENYNIVINQYSWDYDGDGVVDASDAFGQPRTFIYTGEPGTTFDATLTVTPASGEPVVDVQTITIDNEQPVVSISPNATNGHAPLSVTYTVQAEDSQGIKTVSIDFDGDGSVDDIEEFIEPLSTSGVWSFDTLYVDEGEYQAIVTVVDGFGGETIVSNNSITVDVNDVIDPIVELTASAVEGTVGFTTTLTATAELFDGSAIAQWQWDLDGDGNYETTGGSDLSDVIATSYKSVDYYYPVVKVVTDSGRSARASLKITTTSTQVPSLSIPDTSDTINADAGEVAIFTISVPYQTDLAIWVEDDSGALIKTLQLPQETQLGDYDFEWDGINNSGAALSSNDYYIVLGYTQYGQNKEVDLRTSTGGSLSYYRRTETNPRYFDRMEAPLIINYEVDNPAKVSFFWQVSFGAKIMTLMEGERLGRGSYSLYWNGEYPNGKIVSTGLNLMPGIVRYDLPYNVIYVKETPRIESFTLTSTWLVDPRREPIGLELTLSKRSTIEMVVSDMEKGVDVATEIYVNVDAGEQVLTWDGKNNDGQYLSPRDYRIGVRSVDATGNRSLFWYRTQRIDY